MIDASHPAAAQPRALAPGPHPLMEGLPEPWAVEWGEDRFGVFTAFAVGEVVQRLRWVPAGRFMMGSPKGDSESFDLERPQHDAILTRGYWLGETPVTQGLWTAVMGETPSRFKGPDRPVENVSWEDCHGFLVRLDDVVRGLGCRLPTEAEWEWACRAGGEEARYGELDEVAWHLGNSSGETHPVVQKASNPLGLYDMLGNVYEWCADWGGSYEPGRATDPTGPPAGSGRVFRGGSWRDPAYCVRAAFRNWHHPGLRSFDLGFRLARGQVPGPGGASPGPGGAGPGAGARSRRP